MVRRAPRRGFVAHEQKSAPVLAVVLLRINPGVRDPMRDSSVS